MRRSNILMIVVCVCSIPWPNGEFFVKVLNQDLGMEDLSRKNIGSDGLIMMNVQNQGHRLE